MIMIKPLLLPPPYSLTYHSFQKAAQIVAPDGPMPLTGIMHILSLAAHYYLTLHAVV